MWGRKKKSEADAQAAIATVAPVSYWATHPEPDTAQAGEQPGARATPAGQVRTTIIVNGRQIDPAPPEGRQVLAVASGALAYGVAPAGADGTDELYMFTGSGGGDRLNELIPFIDEHRRRKITDAEFEAAQRRILGAPEPHASTPAEPIPGVVRTIAVNGTQYDADSPEGRLLMSLVEQRDPAVRDALQPESTEHVGELLPLIEQHPRQEITDAEFDAPQRRITG